MIQISETTIKAKPSYWKYIPILKQSSGIVVGSQIYTSKKIFNNLKTRNPNPLYLAIIEHEKTHLFQKKKIGTIKYDLKFWISKKFRLHEELSADKNAMKVLKKNGGTYPIRKRSIGLSSWIYGKMISQKQAEKKLREIWNKIDKTN